MSSRFVLLGRRCLGQTSAILGVNEERRILRTDKHILVANDGMPSVGTNIVDLDREAMQVVRLPDSNFERLRGVGRGYGDVFDLNRVPIQRLRSDGHPFHTGPRSHDGERRSAKKWMGVVHAGSG